MSYYRNNSSGIPLWLLIVLIIVLSFFIEIENNISIENSREKQNMVSIEEGFAYDRDTRIIYRETISGRSKYSSDKAFYSPYLSADGNYYKYIAKEWVEMVDE